MENLKVLIVVDMQQGFIDEFNNFLIDKINGILNNYDKVFFTQFINRKNSLYQTKLNWHKLETTSEQKIVCNIPKNAAIFKKYTYTLSQENLAEIKNLGITNVDICGVKTHACVDAIAIQLFDCGIYPNILLNYTHTKFDKKEIEEILCTKFGKLNNKQ